MSRFGRRTPSSWDHVDNYPLRMLLDDSAHPLTLAPANTEKSLGLPSYWQLWDQGNEGACVGFGTSAMSGITNTYQVRQTGSTSTLRFAPHWLYEQAQLADEFPDTPPEEGTTVKAACDVLRIQGHRRVRYGVAGPIELKWGIQANRWATTVDQLRSAIYSGLAISLGINWYAGMMDPVLIAGEYWCGAGNLGQIVGGHDVCLFRMSDRRQAFKLMNSWGTSFPPSWISYDLVQRLIDEDGEATVITDR